MCKLLLAINMLSILLILSAVSGVIGQKRYDNKHVSGNGMFNHIRVGRSQLGHSWMVDPEEAENFNEMKRLIPFPRIGRALNNNYLNSESLPGLWLAPHPDSLLFKESEDNQIDQTNDDGGH